MHGDWIRHRLRPPLPQLRNALVGYIVSFVARMSLYLLVLRPDAAVFDGTWTMPDVELVKLREDGSV